MVGSRRKVGLFEVAPIGLGCMSLSHAYGSPPPEEYGERLLKRALDLGYDFFDTASAYGAGRNEKLLGRALGSRRHEFVLASKCGLSITREGKRLISGRPEFIANAIDESLERLGVDHIDLYYLHRLDREVPIEESVGALKRGVEAGKLREIGLSEMSAATLRRAHAVHPIAAMQTEYSLWTRNPEIAVLDACRELGTTFVAFSPVARGFLADAIHDPQALPDGDIRKAMPRFQEPEFSRNLNLLEEFCAIAAEVGCTPAQLALAWLLHKDELLIPLPGTASIEHLEEDFAATNLTLSAEVMGRLERLINHATVHGHRYAAPMRVTIDTEEFAD